MIVSEPDGTFVGNDVIKLLAYSDDFDAVFGTRTSSILIGDGANMGLFLKYGNFFVAKYMELLFNTHQLTDAGCTMRLIKRNSLSKINNSFRIGGNSFGPEMMMLIFIHKISSIEIPLNYRERVGESSVTGSFWKALKLGFQMIFIVTKVRFLSLFGLYK